MNDTLVLNAVQQLKLGKVLAYPTEAVWGLGCDPYNQAAFNYLLELKNRPQEKGVILIAGHINQVRHWLDDLTQAQQERILATWPGAYTWIIPKPKNLPQWITGDHSTVAIRVTAHPLIQQLCHAFGNPIVSTSANISGLPAAQTLAQTQHYFAQRVRYLDGNTLGASQPSQIRDAISNIVIRA